MTQLEDLKYARPERTPSADGAARAMAAGKRRRRARYAVAATVAVTVAGFVSLESLLLSNSPSPPAGTPHPAAEPVLYTAGQIDGYPSTDPRFCLTGDFGSVFDGPRDTRDPCLNETILRNVDARKLPMPVLQGGGLRSKGTVRVTGTYADGVLTLTKPPAAAKPVEPNVNFPIPCGSGRRLARIRRSQHQPGRRIGDEQVRLRAPGDVRRLVARTRPGGCHRRRRHQRRGRRPARAGQQASGRRLRHESRHTDRYLTSVANEITRLAMTNKQLYLSGWGPSAVTSTVDVSLRIADQATVRYFAARFPPGVIRLQPLLTRLP